MIRRFERSIIIARCPSEDRFRWSPPEGSIDLWWRGGKNGNLMMTLAHLLKRNSVWRRRPIRVLVPAGPDQDPDKARQSILKMIEQARVEATPEIVVAEDVEAALRERSAGAAVVFVGFEPPEAEDTQTFHREMKDATEGLQQVLFVSSAGGVSLAG